MDNLELCKKFAELEGVKVEELSWSNVVLCLVRTENRNHEYNPITDLALNCAARDKYEVEIDYIGCYGKRMVGIFHHEKDRVSFESKEDIPRATIECILKSKGLI